MYNKFIVLNGGNMKMRDEPNAEKPSALKSIYLELLRQIEDGDKTYTVEQLTQYIKEKDED
jgi:hypothetical protein